MIDRFLGVIVLFGRMLILGVVAGLVVSLVVLVPSGATEAVDPGALDVTDFVVLGVDGVYLKQNASVTSGDVGAVNATSGPYLAGSQETTIGLGVTVPAGSRVFGDSVKLRQGSTVGDVYTNDLSGDGTVTGSVFTPVSFPLDVTLPAIPVAQPGVTDFDVAQGDSLTLDAGSYGLLKARKDATVTLTGGVYEFSEWDIRDRVVVEVLAASQIVVAGRVDLGKNSALTPGVGVEPFEVELTVLGENGNSGNVGATPKAVKFGIGSTVSALVWAPNGTIWLRQNAQGLGQFMGRWVTVGIGVTVEHSVDAIPQLPPTVELVSPVDGAVVFEIEDVEATVSGVSVLSVELRVEGVVAGSLTDPDGDGQYAGLWDTQSSGDGDVVVEVAATDTEGNVGLSESVTVNVANGFSSIDRIIEDYARGLITVDDYATLGMQVLCCAQTLDERYQSDAATLFGEPVGPDNPIDGTQLALMFLSEWDQLSQSVRDDVMSIGTIVYDPTAGGLAPLAAAAQSQGPPTYSAACFFNDPWKIRVGIPLNFSNEAFQCRIESQNFEVFFNEIEQSGPVTAEAIHGATVPDELVDVDPANGIPDYVDVIVTEMETARSVYSAAGFSLPGKRQVVIHELAGPSWVGGYVLPWLVQYERGLSYEGTGLPAQYLPRHEVFHSSQWEYVDLGDVSVPATRTRWMMEATAEWATHKVNEQYPVTDGSGTLYADKLPSQLRAPERLTETGAPFWVPERSYGAFVFFEYLEEFFASAGQPDSDIVRRIWDITGDGFPSKAATVPIDETIQAAGGSLGDVLDGFGLANYRIDRAYADGDRSDWIARLDDDLLDGRPGLNQKYEIGGEAVDLSGIVKLGDGGTAYIEFESLPGVSGTLALTATLPGNVSARVLEVDVHPDLCAGADAAGRPIGASPTMVQLSDTCRTATLVLTYGSLPNVDTYAWWQATFTPGVQSLLSDPGFESGDYATAWSTFTPPSMSGNFGTVTAPVHGGTYAASVDRSEGQCAPEPSGYEQVVAVIPGQVYSGFVWVKHARWGSGDVYLEIVDSDGTQIANDTLSVIDLTAWQQLAVSFTPTNTEVRFRMGVVGDVCSSRGFVFDDALLIEQPVANFTNPYFDDGLDGWTTIGAAEGTVTETMWAGRTAIQIVSDTAQPVGVGQWFDSNDFNFVVADVAVSGGIDAQVTLELVRLDGTTITPPPRTISPFEGWVSLYVDWPLGSEDLLMARLTTTQLGDIVVDTISPDLQV